MRRHVHQPRLGDGRRLRGRVVVIPRSEAAHVGLQFTRDLRRFLGERAISSIDALISSTAIPLDDRA